eukprot:580294_1
MQEINIFDPNLAQTHPTLVPWVQGMQQAGYTPPQIQMYFKQQTQAQLQLHEQNNAQRQQQKLQMAQNIVHAYQGRVTLEQVMSMAFDRVQNLYKEIVSRINQTSGQAQHDQSSHNNNTNSNPQPPPVQQNMNIFDPSLIHAHPTLVPWVQSMQQAGYTPEQTQMYFQQQIQAQSYPQQQKQKVQMAQNIAQAYQGRVTLEQVLAMSFERVQNLYQEIISRLNQLDTQQDVTTNNRKRVLASPDDNADIGPATKRQKMDENKPSQQLLDKKIEDFQKRMRAAKFTKKDGEIINNSCYIKQKIQIKDSTSDLWVNATVIDKENNWICVHFDGWPSKYDQKIHVMKHARRLRALGADLGETQEERDIRQEMESFLVEVEQLNWKLQTVDADGNCLYRCFAINIYADTDKHMLVRRDCCQYMRQNKSFFVNFIPDFEERLREKEAEYEWGDHVDITALSELYNVRVRVFEYDCASAKLYMSFDLGEHEQSVNLPLILLARHRKKHYNIICDPQAVHSRPLGLPSQRCSSDTVSLREIRLNEDAKEEHKEGADDDDDDAVIEYYINEEEFIAILEEYAVEPPLDTKSCATVFSPLTAAFHRKLELHCKQNHLDERILNRFWETQNHIRSPKEWCNELQQKIPNGQYPINAAITSFNQVIVNAIADNLQAVIGQSRKRQSTIDVSRMQSHKHYEKQQKKLKKQQQQQQQPMDIDK